MASRGAGPARSRPRGAGRRGRGPAGGRGGHGALAKTAWAIAWSWWTASTGIPDG